MKSAILMTSVAVAALAAPAWAGPDRFEQGCRYGVSAAPCVQQNLTNHGGKPGQSGTAAVSRTGQSNSDDSLSDEVGDTANDAGGVISHTANEAGDTIGHAAGEAGDAIGHAANEAGDAIGDAS
jgi:hypothetical protein